METKQRHPVFCATCGFNEKAHQFLKTTCGTFARPKRPAKLAVVK
jgi:hypothetical protein